MVPSIFRPISRSDIVLKRVGCFVVFLTLPTVVVAQRVIVREIDLVAAPARNVPEPATGRSADQGAGAGRVQGGALSGAVPTARMDAFLRLPESAVRVGTRIEAIVEIVNRSSLAVDVPSDAGPDASPEIGHDALMTVSAELLCDGRREAILPGPTLHGREGDPASRTTLKPGEGIRLRLEFGWSGSTLSRRDGPRGDCSIRPLVGFLRSFPRSHVVVLPGEASHPVTVQRTGR